MRRLPLAVMTLVMIAFGLAPVAAAHNGGYGHYEGPCYDDQTGGAGYGKVVTRISKTKGVEMTVTARALRPCTAGDWGSHQGWSLVLANIQGQDDFGHYQFTQIGLGKWRQASPDHPFYCDGAAASNDQTYFVMTGNRQDSGDICVMKVDFDNDGSLDTPVGGRDYKFRITEYTSSGNKYWRYCVFDLTTGLQECVNKPRVSDNGGVGGNSANWWGCEVDTNSSAVGVGTGDSAMPIKQPKYWRASDGLWVYTENSTWAAPWPGGSPAYYNFTTDQAGLGETLYCETDWHS